MQLYGAWSYTNKTSFTIWSLSTTKTARQSNAMPRTVVVTVKMRNNYLVVVECKGMQTQYCLKVDEGEGLKPTSHIRLILRLLLR